MKNAIQKKKIASLISVGVLISVFLFSSLVNAATYTPEYQPIWWDNADAKVIFEDMETAEALTSTPSEGTKGYNYTAIYSVQSSPVPNFETKSSSYSTIDLTSLNIRLDNEENPDKIKQFWVAFRYNAIYDPAPSTINIHGYYEDGSVSPVKEFDSFVSGNGWVYATANLSPQPAWEEFTIQVKGELDDQLFYEVKYLEVGTRCTETPIPSSLCLLGGGLFWLINLKRRKS